MSLTYYPSGSPSTPITKTNAVQYDNSIEPTWNKYGLSSVQDTKSYANNDYYYVKNYQDWIDMVNDAFSLCLTQLVQATGTAQSPLKSVKPPFLELDPKALKCILNADLNWFNNDSGGSGI